jgi:hypothetical protein
MHTHKRNGAMHTPTRAPTGPVPYHCSLHLALALTHIQTRSPTCALLADWVWIAPGLSWCSRPSATMPWSRLSISGCPRLPQRPIPCLRPSAPSRYAHPYPYIQEQEHTHIHTGRLQGHTHTQTPRQPIRRPRHQRLKHPAHGYAAGPATAPDRIGLWWQYLSPELLLKRGYNRQVDLWCIGILAYMLATSTFPFEGRTQPEILAAIVAARCVPRAHPHTHTHTHTHAHAHADTYIHTQAFA